jgi:hypothetical protein
VLVTPLPQSLLRLSAVINAKVVTRTHKTSTDITQAIFIILFCYEEAYCLSKNLETKVVNKLGVLIQMNTLKVISASPRSRVAHARPSAQAPITLAEICWRTCLGGGSKKLENFLINFLAISGNSKPHKKTLKMTPDFCLPQILFVL